MLNEYESVITSYSIHYTKLYDCHELGCPGKNGQAHYWGPVPFEAGFNQQKAVGKPDRDVSEKHRR